MPSRACAREKVGDPTASAMCDARRQCARFKGQCNGRRQWSSLTGCFRCRYHPYRSKTGRGLEALCYSQTLCGHRLDRFRKTSSPAVIACSTILMEIRPCPETFFRAFPGSFPVLSVFCCVLPVSYSVLPRESLAFVLQPCNFTLGRGRNVFKVSRLHGAPPRVDVVGCWTRSSALARRCFRSGTRRRGRKEFIECVRRPYFGPRPLRKPP